MPRKSGVCDNLELPFETSKAATRRKPAPNFPSELAAFAEYGRPTEQSAIHATSFSGEPLQVPAFINEFWTARQRAAHSLHEVSYRACFKPQLPAFFIDRLTARGDLVYDPFMGRGTTLVEAALRGRTPIGCDVNPLSCVMARARLNPPLLAEVHQRLREIPFSGNMEIPDDLLVFYHLETLREIVSLKNYFISRKEKRALDAIDEWICLVALNRLTGHSRGFFSVYTMPPNQAVSIKSQQKINARRKQTPTRRDVPALIYRKSRQLLGDCTDDDRRTFAEVILKSMLLTATSDRTPQIASNSISLVVTSPPFLDVVDYATDNWLRCWFLGIDARSVQLTVPKKLEDWQRAMTAVFHELRRVVRPGGHVAFEVGEVHGGKIHLEEAVIACGLAAGLKPLLCLINAQKFTKTANCWGVNNNSKGTNTNRIVLFRKE
jgi:hypothetical protein